MEMFRSITHCLKSLTLQTHLKMPTVLDMLTKNAEKLSSDERAAREAARVMSTHIDDHCHSLITYKMTWHVQSLATLACSNEQRWPRLQQFGSMSDTDVNGC